MKNFSDFLSSAKWLPGLLALFGAALCGFQLWNYAHTQVSVLDEGAYLYKGYLFATGQYRPYQPYGPWTNHMPLAFLIPGTIQKWFGPGLETARYFSIFLTMLLLLGLWILARRLGGRWWAAGAIWVMALNPAILKPYSTAVSQGLVACMLVWSLVFTLGENRPLWQIALGALISGIIGLTRFNMLLVTPFLVLYIFWQHGKKAGFLAAFVSGSILAIGHAIYWPEILRQWVKIPKPLSPFLNPWRFGQGITRVWDPQTDLASQILSFFHGIRFHFVAAVGVFATWLLWPARKDWKRESDFRIAVFLSVLYFVCLIAHMWAALIKDYCPFCFAGYMAFFSILGLLLLIVSFSGWQKDLPIWRQFTAGIILVIITAGIGYGSFEDIGSSLANLQLPNLLLGRPAGADPVTIGALLVNKYGMDLQLLRRLLPVGLGIGAGALILGSGILFSRVLREQSAEGTATRNISPAYISLVGLLILGLVLSPTVILGGGYRTYDCAGDVIASNRVVGEYLAKTLTPGSQVYWRGGLSVAPLLYAPDIRIYPPQINDGYSYFLDGDPDLLLRVGYWNRELDQQWLQEADYVLIENRIYSRKWKDALQYTTTQLPVSPLTVTCNPDSSIRIFARSK